MSEDTAPLPARRSRAATVAKWLLIALIGLALLVGAIILGLNTGPGRSFIGKQLAGFETASGINVRIGRIEGSIYGRMRLIDFEVYDPKGVFARSPEILLDWRPFAYSRGKIDVRELTAKQVRLLRMPALKPVPSDPDAPLLPDIDLTVGRLRIDQLIVDPPVTGKRHIVRLAGNADIADGRARINADAAALREAGLSGGDVLQVRLDAVPDANRLGLQARLAAPAGGLVDSYAGLGKPLFLGVDGQGDWANWRGRAVGRLGGQPLADLGVTGRNGTFQIRGQTRPGLVLSGPPAALTAPALAIDMTAAVAKRRIDTRLVARSSALAVAANGLVDLGESRFSNLRVNAALLNPRALGENVRGRDLRIAAILDGPFATPSVNYRATAAAIGFGELGIDSLVASGRATVDADRILIPVSATARRVTGLQASTADLLTNLRVDGDLAWSNGRLLSDNLHLRSSGIDATAIVIADVANGRYTGALKGRVNDYQIDGLGRVSLTTDAELVTGPKGGFGIKGVVRVVTRRFDNATVRDTLGGNAVMTASFTFDEDGVASVRNLRMDAPLFRITDGSGSYRPDGRIDFRATGTSSQYGPLSVVATGTLERPKVLLRAARPGFGLDLRDVEAQLTGTAAGYEVRARGRSAYGPFVADLLVRSGKGPLAIDIHRATLAGINVAGRVVQTAAGPFAGTLSLSGNGLLGSVRLAAAGANQRADVDLSANSARIPGDVPITIGAGVIRASVILYPNAPAISATARLSNVRQGTLTLASLQGRVNYQNQRGTAAIVTNGRSGVPFSVAAQAAFAPDRVVANAKGSVNSIAFRLAAPAIVTKSGGDWVLAPTRLIVPQGETVLAGRYGRTTQFQAQLDNMDMGIVEAFSPGLGLGGKASGRIDVAMAAGNAVPTVNARLTINRFTRTAAYVVSDPVDVAMLGTLGREGGDIRAVIRRGGAAVGRLQARLAPLGPGAGLSERLFGAPLSGGIRYNGPAEVLWTLTGIPDQQLSGPVVVAADFGGRLDNPTLIGVARANALRYENQTYGTVISNIALQGRFTQSRLDLVSLTGKAGKGTIQARGTVGLDAASGFPIDIAAQLDHAQLARSDALGATVSGKVTVTNSRAQGAWIRGDLRIPEARYQIIRQGAAEVAELEGVRRKSQIGLPAEEDEASAVPSNWKLDIRVRADNQIFVSGMGLEAEWATDLRVTGSASDPRIVGRLEVVRGTYSFAGRRFALDEDGEVVFDGGKMLDPQLSLAANTTVEGVTATINIGGRAQNPQVTFSSTPNLPQDEILSRLLFGSSVTSLSPTQAIQLAAALNSLRGSGGGLNPLGKLRSAVGVDRLRVLGADKTAGRGTALAAGQYISDDIYVEVITDARGFTATQLEIALSKTLSVLSQTGSFGGSSVNLRYSKDY